jgi:hypothetical protein
MLNIPLFRKPSTPAAPVAPAAPLPTIDIDAVSDAHRSFERGQAPRSATAAAIFADSLATFGPAVISRASLTGTPEQWQTEQVSDEDHQDVQRYASHDEVYHRVNVQGVRFLAALLDPAARLADLNLPPSFVLRGVFEDRPVLVPVWAFAAPVMPDTQPFTHTYGLRAIARAIRLKGQVVHVQSPTHLPVAGLTVGGHGTTLTRVHGPYKFMAMTDQLGLTDQLRTLSGQVPAPTPAPVTTSGQDTGIASVQAVIDGFFGTRYQPPMFDPKVLYAELGKELKQAGHTSPEAIAGDVVLTLYRRDPDWSMKHTDLAKVLPCLRVGMQ